jgi:hypothetical protein
MSYPGLKIFYRTFISKRGVQSGNSQRIEEVLESRIEKELRNAPFKIRYDDIKCRMNFYRMAPIYLAVILSLCYISKFVELMENYKDVAKWMNSIMMILGTLIHSKNKLIDIYGYLGLAAILILEVNVGRSLRNRIKQSMAQNFKARASVSAIKGHLKNAEFIKHMVEEDIEELRDQSKSNVTKFLIKTKQIDPDEDLDMIAESKPSVGIFDKQRKSINFYKIDSFTPFEYDPNFLGNLHIDANPVVEKERYESIMVEDKIEELKFDSFKNEAQLTQVIENQIDYMTLGNKVGKLLYYFENRDLYLNCKMFYGAVYLMFRLAFFVLISIGNRINSIISLVSLCYLCYIWYRSGDQPLQSVNSLNKLAVVIISIKYLIGMLDIQHSNYSGDDLKFESSIVLMFVGNVENKNYYYFKCLISNSLQDYWLLYECSIFISIQLLVFFYTVILQLNTTVVNRHITRILYMTVKHIHYNLSVMTHRPFYINFERWFSPQIKYAEMFLKFGTIYLPIIAAISLLAVSQSYATLPILAIVVLSLVVIYHLIFTWMYSILDQKAVIGKYFSQIRMLIWVYIITGSVTRVFERPFKNAYQASLHWLISPSSSSVV